MIHTQAYYIRRGYGVSAIRNEIELRALIAFCKEALSEKHIELNPEREEIFKHTLELYHESHTIHCGCGSHPQNAPYWNIYDYINDHAGWYWS